MFQDSLPSASVCKVHVVTSNAGFKGGGKPCPKTREVAALRQGIREAARFAGIETKPLVH